MDEILSVFSVEAREQLEAMEAGLMQLEQGDRDPETINAVFRAAHTIKGGAGVVEIHSVEKFTHVLENVLDRLRNGEIEVSGDMISALLLGCDHIGALLGVVQAGEMEPDDELKQAGEAITEQLRPFLGAKPPAGSATSAPVEPVGRARVDVQLDGHAGMAQPHGVVDVLVGEAEMVADLVDQDVAHDVARLRAAGSPIGEPVAGSRVGPDGEVVRWVCAFPELGPERPPFLIEHETAGAEWDDEARAARAAFRHPGGGRVRGHRRSTDGRLSVRHPGRLERDRPFAGGPVRRRAAPGIMRRGTRRAPA
jgi:HPt (histidine-containing phosphotransfer) domain-containing protein